MDAGILPDFEDPMTATVPMSQVGIDPNLVWPTIAWESAVLEKAQHPLLPRVLDSFSEGEFDYLIEESLSGRLLWDAWDDPAITVAQRFGWLEEVAEGLHGLHRAGAILEGLRPDIVAVTSSGHAVLTDVADLLPLPLPPDPPIRATHYTAPELVLASDHADARADLYSFGAMLYALHVGRELTEMDFEKQQGVPKAIIPTFPDVHPLFARLVSKTFTRDPAQRFPTDEAAREDPTGFTELMRTLEHCRRSLATARLEIAAWTTTGMVRTGNEDAFALLHAVESRQDDLGEYALVLLSDGMGGYEAGEVAAALAIQTMRKYLLQQKLFAALAGESTAPPGPFDVAICRQHLLTALKEANRNVYVASKEGAGRRGMGCTAEVVYVDGRHVIVGHVGDSG